MADSPVLQEDTDMLVGLQKAEFAKASSLRSRVLNIQVGLAIAATASTFPVGEVAGTLLGVAALVLTVALAWVTWRLRQTRGHAEQLRRVTLLVNGLGMELRREQFLYLTSEAAVSIEEGRRLRDPEYFRTQEPQGLRRLAELLLESAFWTRTLAGYASREAWWMFVGAVIMGFVALAVLVVLSPSAGAIGIRLFSILLVTLVSGEFLGAALAYGAAREDIGRLNERLIAELASEPNQLRIMNIMADYNATVEGMPSFSAGLYGRHRKALNEQYGMWKTGPQP